MTGKVIPFPSRDVDGVERAARRPKDRDNKHPAKIIEMRARPIEPFARADQEARAYELYVNASAIDEEPSRYDEAGAMYLEAIALDPELALAHTNLGNILYRQGKYDAAERRYVSALSVDPRQPEANYNLGYIRLELREPLEATRWFSKAIAADPQFADAWFNQGRAYEMLGHVERMREAFQTYLVLEPQGLWADMARKSMGAGRPPPKGRTKK